MVWRRVRDYFRRSRARQAELKYKAFVKKARQTVRKRPGAAAASRATALAASFQQWLPVAAWALGTVAACVPPAPPPPPPVPQQQRQQRRRDAVED